MSDSDYSLPSLETQHKTPSKLPKPKRVKRKDMAGTPSASGLECEEVCETYCSVISTAMANVINRDYARAMYASLCLPDSLSNSSGFQIDYFHGYSYPHMFAALLNTVTQMVGLLKTERLHITALPQCLENISNYWLAVRAGLLSGRLSQRSAGCGLLRCTYKQWLNQYDRLTDCCEQAFYEKRHDKASAIIEHHLKHFAHTPSASEWKNRLPMKPFGEVGSFHIDYECKH